MKLQVFHEPLPYVIIDDFLDDLALANGLALNLEEVAKIGTHRGVKYEGLERREIYLYEAQGMHAITAEHLRQIFLEKFWSLKPQIEKLPYPYPLLNTTNNDAFLLGFYGKGDKYSLHFDKGLFSILLYLHTEEIQGGEFILTNQIKGDNFKEPVEVVIESKPNRLIMFPSRYWHGVREVTGDTKRMALTYFTSIDMDY